MKIAFKKLLVHLRRMLTRLNWELFRELVQSNFKVHDHNSFLGVFWSFLSPTALFIVMYFIFRQQFSTGLKTYPIYLLSGIVTVNFFVIATTHMIRLLTTSREFILNTTIPRDIFIASSFFTHAYKFTIEIFFCSLLAFFFGVFPWSAIIPLTLLWMAYILFVIGVGMMLSLLYCHVRDAEHIWGLISRILFFASPVIYHLDHLSPLTRFGIYFFNPLVPFVEAFHQLLTQGHANPFVYAHSLFLGIITFVAGYGIFLYFEKQAMEMS
jgi:ABC-type polysaccharide/polyol phosphate export permease